MSEALSFEEYLDRYGTLTYTNVGVSMLPLLRQDKDLFTVAKKGPARCRLGDVVLFRRGKRYVLHRIIEVRKEDYVTLGDNSIRKEYGVRDADILGVMTGFVREGRAHSVEERTYKAYSFFMVRTAGARTGAKKVRAAVLKRAGRILHE